MARSDVFVAKTEFAVNLNGVPTVIHKGETVRAGHPLLKGRASLFEPYELKVDYDLEDKIIEQATAAPGEKRGT